MLGPVLSLAQLHMELWLNPNGAYVLPTSNLVDPGIFASSAAILRNLEAAYRFMGLDTAANFLGTTDGQPLVLSTPDAPASQALTRIAEALGRKPRGLAGLSLGITPARRA